MSNERPLGPSMTCDYISEPMLVFGGGGEDVDPKHGITTFGPKSFNPTKRHPATVRIGFVGTADTIRKSREWLVKASDGVAGDEKHPDFPGYRSDRGFRSELHFDDDWVAQITSSELDGILEIESSADRFGSALALLESKLALLASQDLLPEYVIVALPDSLRERCGVADYRDPDLGMVHRDLRRAFKAMAMKYRLATQILNQPTIDGRDRDKPSKIAWNFFTGLYFKAGGQPWGPIGLLPGTCYIGIGFYRPLGSYTDTMQTSLVQAFDEYGNSLILRGHNFTWDPRDQNSRSPHLNEAQAFELVDLVLTRYQEEMHQSPQRVVVHKSSRFWPGERLGFKEALRNRVSRYDLVALERTNRVRVLPVSSYPVLRGTHVSVGKTDYLYTTGFITELGQFHGVHVPSPLQIADHDGRDTPREVLLQEILTLTKMNMNSSRLGGSLPITLRFSELVGDIMKEIPSDREPLPQFKFYM